MAIRVTVRINAPVLEGILASDEVQRHMDSSANAALGMQKALVPVDTGNLLSHLEIRKTADGLGRQIGVWDVDYAAAVELGHVTKAGTWVPAQPYVRPSIDALRKGLGNA